MKLGSDQNSFNLGLEGGVMRLKLLFYFIFSLQGREKGEKERERRRKGEMKRGREGTRNGERERKKGTERERENKRLRSGTSPWCPRELCT